MIFSEIYGEYFNAVAKILDTAVRGELNENDIISIVGESAFGESILSLPQKIKIFRSILWGKACRMMECHLKLFVNILIGNITSFISCLPALEWGMMLA